MRIGLIIYGSLDTVSGGYLYDRQLANYLRQQGDEIQLISLPWMRYGKHLLHNFDRSLLHQLQQSSFDILLQDELNHPSLFWLNKRLQRHISYPVISIVHHLRSSEQHSRLLLLFYRWIEQHYLRTIDGFVFNSKTTRAEVMALLKYSRPHTIAYPAADHHPSMVGRESAANRAHEPGPLRLIFVGNVIPRKGCHTLLKALARLPEGSWRLAIVGNTAVDPTYVRRLQYQAHSSGISPYIHWHGHLSDALLTTLFEASHLLAVPSTYEGFGIVYLEAMNHGLPALATTSGAAHEIITDGLNGILVPPGDPISLAKRIQAFIEDRALLAQQSLAALDRALLHPTWTVTMQRARQFLITMTNS